MNNSHQKIKVLKVLIVGRLDKNTKHKFIYLHEYGFCAIFSPKIKIYMGSSCHMHIRPRVRKCHISIFSNNIVIEDTIKKNFI